MKLVFILGSGAVGKMSVGQALCKITPLRLFHNHMAIEPVIEIFGNYNHKVVNRFRDIVFEEFAGSERYGLIFTCMMAFDHQSEWDYLEHVKNIFLQQNPDTQFYYIELIASQETRLARNRTENRLAHKASKRDLEASDARVRREDANYRLVSAPGEIPFANYLRLNNENLTPDEAAQIIIDHFGFTKK